MVNDDSHTHTACVAILAAVCLLSQPALLQPLGENWGIRAKEARLKGTLGEAASQALSRANLYNITGPVDGRLVQQHRLMMKS